jgi:hypothetical protein
VRLLTAAAPTSSTVQQPTGSSSSGGGGGGGGGGCSGGDAERRGLPESPLLSIDEVVSNVHSFLFAGFETTAILVLFRSVRRGILTYLS